MVNILFLSTGHNLEIGLTLSNSVAQGYSFLLTNAESPTDIANDWSNSSTKCNLWDIFPWIFWAVFFQWETAAALMEDEYDNFHVNTLLSLKVILLVLMGLECLTFYDTFFSLPRTSSLYGQDRSDASNLVLHHFGWSCEMITIRYNRCGSNMFFHATKIFNSFFIPNGQVLMCDCYCR